jgi:hypothetical protein
MTMRPFLSAFFSRPVMLQAVKVASVVGPILLMVNHGEQVLASPLSVETLRKLAMNLTVPYLVASYSSARTVMRAVRASASGE